MEKLDKKIIFLIIFGIIVFGLRLFNINEAIYDDESNFAYTLTVMDRFGFNPDYPSSQLFNLLYKPFIALFGLEVWVFRFIPWIFGILNTFLLYIVAQKNWNKNVAFWSTFLILISFYSTLSSLQFDIEGSLIMFLVLVFFGSFLESEKRKQKSICLFWQIISGFGLGLCVVSKYNLIYIVIVLAIYILIKYGINSNGFKKLLQLAIPIYLIGLLIFIFFIIFGTFVAPDNGEKSVHLFTLFDGFKDKYRPEIFSFLGIVLYVLWSTPLLFGFYFLSIFRKKDEILLPFLWITIGILFYTFVITYGSIERYLMNTIPALAIIGGHILSKISIFKKRSYYLAIGLPLFTLSFFILNMLNMKYVPRFPASYFNELLHFNPNFLFSYTSASGPTFGVNFITIGIVFVLGFFLLVLCLLYNKTAKQRTYQSINDALFLTFLIVSISFNIFLISEYLFHPTGVDVSNVKLAMIEYVNENNLPNPRYSNDEGILWYLDHNYWISKYEQWPQKSVGIPDNELYSKAEQMLQNLKFQGGTAVLLYWPPFHEKSPAWQITVLCNSKKKFYSKEILIGEIFDCKHK